MTASELTAGVTRRTTLVVLLAAVAGGWLGGAPGALGVLAGGVLGLVSFRLLAARLRAVVAVEAAPGVPWSVLAGLRFTVVAGVAAMLFVTGWAHPVGWLVGYTALPLAVILQGLRLTREERRA
jgi:hypothetical protein